MPRDNHRGWASETNDVSTSMVCNPWIDLTCQCSFKQQHIHTTFNPQEYDPTSKLSFDNQGDKHQTTLWGGSRKVGWAKSCKYHTWVLNVIYNEKGLEKNNHYLRRYQKNLPFQFIWFYEKMSQITNGMMFVLNFKK